MSTSLARKLRRIGLTRTFTEVPVTVIVKDEQGVEIEQTTTRILTNRHRIQYSPEELETKCAEIVAAWPSSTETGTSNEKRSLVIRPALVQMFLSSAYLCPECATVSNDSSGCPRGCGPVLSLAGILDRQPAKEPVPANYQRKRLAEPETTHARTH